MMEEQREARPVPEGLQLTSVGFPKSTCRRRLRSNAPSPEAPSVPSSGPSGSSERQQKEKRREIIARLVGEEFRVRELNTERMRRYVAMESQGKCDLLPRPISTETRFLPFQDTKPTAMTTGPSASSHAAKRKRHGQNEAKKARKLKEEEERWKAEVEGTNMIDASLPTSRFSGQDFNRSEWTVSHRIGYTIGLAGEAGFEGGSSRECSIFIGETDQSTEFATRTMTFENPQVQGPVQDPNPTSQIRSPDRHNGE